MATGQEPIRIGRQPPPFAVPPERRSPTRRLRGRLVAGHPLDRRSPAGRGRLDGLLGLGRPGVAGTPARPDRPDLAFWEAMQKTRAFVVHVLAVSNRALAERFSEVRPPIHSPFERLEVAESPWGPVLGGRPRAACRLTDPTVFPLTTRAPANASPAA